MTLLAKKETAKSSKKKKRFFKLNEKSVLSKKIPQNSRKQNDKLAGMQLRDIDLPKRKKIHTEKLNYKLKK